MKSFATS